MDEVLKLGARGQLALMRRGEVSAEEIMRATLERIAAVNGPVNAIIELCDGDALLAQARASSGSGALQGLPVAIKDLADVRGMVTSQGSPVFAGQVAAQDSLHVARMRAAGAIFIGKTNVPEFGLGSHTFNPVHGATRNPYDHARSAGGSSGGAAVALATRMLALADGSDMMGSLRNPAGWNNVYGMRPSWGRVPARSVGDVYFNHLSTNGPMARDPEDLALLLNVMAGPDRAQPHGLARETFEVAGNEAAGNVAGLRVGWLGDWSGALAFEDGIQDLCEAALAVLSDLGCHVEPLAAPFSRDALWESWTTLRSWNVAMGLMAEMQDPAQRARLKPEAVWECERGLAMSATQIHAASVIRSDWFRAAAELFERYDALILPTAQVWPFPVEWRAPETIGGQAMDTYHRWMEVVVPAGLIGLPVIAMPVGFGAAGLAMGMQVIGRYGNDQGLLRLARAYHDATDWPGRCPPPV